MLTRRYFLALLSSLFVRPTAALSAPAAPIPHYTLDMLWVSLTPEGMVEAAERTIARREAQRRALGMPQGFDIPAKPVPATREECLAEIATLRRLQDEAYEAVMRLPPGPEHESAGLAMV